MSADGTVKRVVSLALAAMLFAALLVSSGCRSTQSPEPAGKPTETVEPTTAPEPTPTATPEPTASPVSTPTPEPTRPAGPSISVRIYLVRGEKLGVAGRTVPAGVTAVARTAMSELLRAPNARDNAYGLGTAIPPGTRLLGLSIKNGVAAVDLSGMFESGGGSLSMQLRVAQVVYTLTQFANVKRVAFAIDGIPVEAIGGEGIAVSPPVGRSEFEDVTPPILVEVPTPGQKVARPIRVAGTANVFEAQFNARLVNARGQVVGPEIPVKATSGSGTRGTFSTLLPYASSAHGPARLQVYDRSEVDGSIEDLLTIPVILP